MEYITLRVFDGYIAQDGSEEGDKGEFNTQVFLYQKENNWDVRIYISLAYKGDDAL